MYDRHPIAPVLYEGGVTLQRVLWNVMDVVDRVLERWAECVSHRS